MFLVFVHLNGIMTPAVRIVAATTFGEARDAVLDLVREWPEFEVIELYDEDDCCAVRVTARPILHHGH